VSPAGPCSSELVLILAPTDSDSAMAANVLREAGIQAEPCESLNGLCGHAITECGAIVIAEEAVTIGESSLLLRHLNSQATWSDLPIILLTGDVTSNAAAFFSESGNVSLLERPLSRLTLVRAVQVALRSRRRQYQVRDLLEQQRSAAAKRDEFFATLSHELRTPLNVILGWIEILHSHELDSLSYKNAVEILERNATVQKGLIDDLLDVSRIVTGKMVFNLAPASLAKLLTTSVNAFQPRAKSKKIDLRLSLPYGELPVMVDDQRFLQVISNLITNSIKFTPEGGRIDVDLTQKNENYLIKVTDTGHGIDPEFLPYIFDRLTQEDMSTTRSHGGLGIGLAICAHIAKEHHGHIHAESAGRGQGTVVTFTLPVLGTQLRAVPLSGLPDPRRTLEGARILVVDDSHDILELIGLWLSKTKAKYRLLDSAQEALNQMPEFKPHLLISDIGMPGMDGYQLISQIRALKAEAGGEMPAIALTAYARDEEKNRAIGSGFQMHISKPISNKQLVTAITEILSDSGLFDERESLKTIV